MNHDMISKMSIYYNEKPMWEYYKNDIVILIIFKVPCWNYPHQKYPWKSSKWKNYGRCTELISSGPSLKPFHTMSLETYPHLHHSKYPIPPPSNLLPPLLQGQWILKQTIPMKISWLCLPRNLKGSYLLQSQVTPRRGTYWTWRPDWWCLRSRN